MLGYLKDRLDRESEAEVGLAPRVAPLTLLKHHIRAQNIAYLAGQMYLSPFPSGAVGAAT